MCVWLFGLSIGDQEKKKQIEVYFQNIAASLLN